MVASLSIGSHFELWQGLLGVGIAAAMIFGVVFLFMRKQNGNKLSQVDQFIYLKSKAEEAEAYRIYGVLFERIALPLQMLFGIVRMIPASDPEFLSDRFHENVAKELKSTMKQITAKDSKGEPSHTKETEKPFDEKELRRNLQLWQEKEIQAAIQRYQIELEENKIRFSQKKIIEGMLPLLAELECTAKGGYFDGEQLIWIANRIKALLEEYEIYPLFFDDERLERRPDLIARFLLFPSSAIKYPGLFIINNGQLEVLGSHVGAR